MKLMLSLSVLAVALLMVLEGPAPAQAESGILGNLQKPWDNLKGAVQKVIETVKKSETWTRISGVFSEAKESIKKRLS